MPHGAINHHRKREPIARSRDIDYGSQQRALHNGGVDIGARVQTNAGLVRHSGASARVECVLDALREAGLLEGHAGTKADRTAVGRSRYEQGAWLRALFLRAGLNGVRAQDMSTKTGAAPGAGAGSGLGMVLSDDAARARLKYNNIVRELGPFAEDVTAFVCFDKIKRGTVHLSMLRKGLDRLCLIRG
jgi:hypothetical protein